MLDMSERGHDDCNKKQKPRTTFDIVTTMKDDAQIDKYEPRTTLNGCWILDKTRDNWSMNEYLQTMNVDPLAIEAHEKGEKEYETYHTIEFINDNTGIKIIKRSRVNNDVVVELNFGQEYQQYLQPNNRLKSSIATSDHLGHVCIKSSLVTTDNHGTAIVTDVKRLQTIEETATPTSAAQLPISSAATTMPLEDDAANNTEETVDNVKMDVTDTAEQGGANTNVSTATTTVLVQELTIQNVETGQSHTTTRYFLPYYETPPHLVPINLPNLTNADHLDDTEMNDE